MFSCKNWYESWNRIKENCSLVAIATEVFNPWYWDYTEEYLAVDANKAVKISNIHVSVIFDQTDWVVIIKRTVYSLIRFSISRNIVTATKLSWIYNKQNHRQWEFLQHSVNLSLSVSMFFLHANWKVEEIISSKHIHLIDNL